MTSPFEGWTTNGVAPGKLDEIFTIPSGKRETGRGGTLFSVVRDCADQGEPGTQPGGQIGAQFTGAPIIGAAICGAPICTQAGVVPGGQFEAGGCCCC